MSTRRSLRSRAATSKRIDVGEVNGRVFINNSSIGLYPEIVVERDQERQRAAAASGSRWLRAALRIAAAVSAAACRDRACGQRVLDAHAVRVDRQQRVRARRARVGTSAAARWRRARDLHAAVDESVADVRRDGARAVARDEPPELETHRVDARRHRREQAHLEVALDGEVTRMAPPLAYRSRPGALVVLGGNA